MRLILCHSNDEPALWAYRGLLDLGLDELELVTAEALAFNLGLTHWLNKDEVGALVRLGDGREIRHEEVSGALNRIEHIPLDHTRGAGPEDSAYAREEISALYVSWLEALPDPVLNRPASPSLAGRTLHAIEWLHMAALAGLPTLDRRWVIEGTPRLWDPEPSAALNSYRTTVVVLEDEVFGAALPHDLMDGCARLARLAGMNLLGVDFCVGSSGVWTFLGASPLPDLRLGGEPLLQSLARTFLRKADHTA